MVLKSYYLLQVTKLNTLTVSITILKSDTVKYTFYVKHDLDIKKCKIKSNVSELLTFLNTIYKSLHNIVFKKNAVITRVYASKYLWYM